MEHHGRLAGGLYREVCGKFGSGVRVRPTNHDSGIKDVVLRMLACTMDDGIGLSLGRSVSL